MELEVGYEPLLLSAARNGRILPGAEGHVDCSVAIRPLEVPTMTVDRSMGDIHPLGNPHYLLDPINGLRVGEILRDRLSRLRGSKRAYFHSRYEEFRGRILEGLFGKALAEIYGARDLEKLAVLQEKGKLLEFLKAHGQDQLLGGWAGALAHHAGSRVVVDHTMWPYFARRFGLVVVGSMEPKPGLQPTTSHLKDLIARMRREGAGIILASSYVDPRHARFVSEHAAAKIVEMAHQAGARDGTDTYLRMIDFNVRQVAAAAGEAPR